MGQVVYSDLVTLDKHPEQLRLFILQKSILCMSITQFEVKYLKSIFIQTVVLFQSF